jgi:predicted metalloprotease with PDZ domain
LTFNNAATNGLVVSNIAANTAFANAGLRAGDQLVSLNGQPITSQQQFYQYLSGPNLGTKPLQLVTLRNGQRVPLTIQPQSLAMYNSPFYQYGFALDNQNPNQVLVQQVYPNTPAYTAGLRQGDVITGLGGQPINGVNAFTQGLTQATGNIPLAVTRAGQTQNLQLQALGNQGSSVRTALRPNYDGAAGSNANPGAAINAGANAQGGATINPPAGANINAQGGTGAATPATPTTPPTSATPATPATPAAPGTAPGIPAAPATPATPATPGAGTSPAPSAP